MHSIALPNTRIRSTQLGFGGSSLMGAAGRRQSLALLEHAFDAGIRHFDVAPMYGYGAAEACLGEFLARHPGQCTVATKYGIAPPSNQGLLRTLRRAVGPVLQRLPATKKRLAAAANSTARLAPKAPFTVAAARASLERSLCALRCDRIDLLLLHEAEAADLTHDDLLRFLEDQVSVGTVGAFGCGSTRSAVPALLDQRPSFCRVLQYEWSILDNPLPKTLPAHTFTLHHRALTERFTELRGTLQRDATLRHRWSGAIDADLAHPGMLAALMLRAALILNPDSIQLVSSRNPAHIAENVRIAGDATLDAPARALYTIAQQEAAGLFLTPAETA